MFSAGRRDIIKVLYVFVTIDIDRPHLINTVARHFKPGSKLAMVSTIQFNHILHAVHNDLLLKEISTVIPQAMPLSQRGSVRLYICTINFKKSS